MPSTRLAQIEAAIQRLTDAQRIGASEEISAAQAALNSPLPKTATLTETLEAGRQRLGQFEQVVTRLDSVTTQIQGVRMAAGVLAKGLEEGLGIPSSQIDAEFDRAFGLVGQAVPTLFIDPETGTVIRGDRVGELRPESGLAVISALAQAAEPMGQDELSKLLFGGEGDKPGLRSRISKLNRSTEELGILSVIGRADDEQGYVLAPGYEVIGVERGAVAARPLPEQPERPRTFKIGEVLGLKGISGVLSEPQVRRLTQELVAKGHLQVGAEVMEGRAQARGASSKVVRDLELTTTGVETMRGIAHQFGAQSRIRINDVVDWLKTQKEQPAAPVPQLADTGKRLWISQVSERAGIPETAMRVLHEIGAFKEGVHFEQRGRVKVYTDEAVRVGRQVARQAKKERQGRFTERLIRDAVGIQEEVFENPYGPNGPKTFTVLEEHAMLQRLQACIPTIERRTGELLKQDFKDELAARLGELTTRFTDDEELAIGPAEKERIRRQAAATVLKLADNARPFNFLRHQHPGLEMVLAFTRLVTEKGQVGMIREFADAIVTPPTTLPDPNTLGRDGLVRTTISVGPMGDQ